MDGIRHRLTEIDEENRLAFCSVCDTIVKIKSGGQKNNSKGVKWRCCKKYNLTMNTLYRPHRLYKKKTCETCGFIPMHPCQLDVDHIDGNHNNNDESNLQTICKNCHALKTQRNKDWESKTLALPDAQ